MQSAETIDKPFVIESETLPIPARAAAVRRPPRRVELGLLSGRNPDELVRNATKLADKLNDVIEHRKMYEMIGREGHEKKYVKVEGWLTLATMLGVFPREKPENSGWIEVDGDTIYEAHVELVSMKTGEVVSGATSECGASDEKFYDPIEQQWKVTWANRPRYARRSMAITRATGKAGRLGFSWIIKLAGYEETPAEEIIDSPPIERRSSGPGAATSGQPIVPWGKNKGIPFSELDDKQLRWYANPKQCRDKRANAWAQAALSAKHPEDESQDPADQGEMFDPTDAA